MEERTSWRVIYDAVDGLTLIDHGRYEDVMVIREREGLKAG
jgi:hypothetical protein